MARKVILDVDPGIDDALALVMALFDPRLDVLAVTAVAGNVEAEQATRNVQAIVEQLDPPRLPRFGAASEPDGGYLADTRRIFGADGLGNAGFQVAELHHLHPSDKLIAEIVRAAPGEVTIVALGPLTNVARAFQRDPGLAPLVGELIMMGGTVNTGGNVTPAAEFNMYCDPPSARAVFRSLVTKTLVPLDVTNKVVMTYGLLDELPAEETKVGGFLRKIVPFTFRAHHRELGLEGIYVHDAVALTAVLHPELFGRESLAGDVETTGELTAGATIFDQRQPPGWRCNMEVALQVDVSAVKDCIVRGLQAAAEPQA